MQYIAKTGSMPKDVADFIQKHKPRTWEDLTYNERESLRTQLSQEQNGLCCYCCQRLKPNAVTIEHLIPRDKDRSLQFDYSNLLLSCTEKNQCDKAKENRLIAMHPLHPDCDKSIKMTMNGQLLAQKHNDITGQAIKTLNLNNKDLIRHRDEMVRTIEQYLSIFKITNNIYELAKNLTYQEEFLSYVKNYPQYYEIQYILKKISQTP